MILVDNIFNSNLVQSPYRIMRLTTGLGIKFLCIEKNLEINFEIMWIGVAMVRSAIYQVVYNINDETNDDDEGSWRHNNHSPENHFHHKIKTKSLPRSLRPKLLQIGRDKEGELSAEKKVGKSPFCRNSGKKQVGFCVNYWFLNWNL